MGCDLMEEEKADQEVANGPATISAIRVTTTCDETDATNCDEAHADGATVWGFILAANCADVTDSTPALAFATSAAVCTGSECEVTQNTWMSQPLGHATFAAGTYCVHVAIDVDKSGAYDDGDALCERQKFFSGEGPFNVTVDQCSTFID